MNASRLLEHFERISEAPDAIPKLRRFILDLAVRGKLVEQVKGDDSALELLKQRSKSGTRPVRTVSRAQSASAPRRVIESDQPFSVPDGWQWVYFDDVAEFAAGRTPPRQDTRYWGRGEYSWASIADMRDGKTLLTTRETVSREAKIGVFRSEPAPVGTMLMSFKLTIGKIVRLGIPSFHNEAIIAIHPLVPGVSDYLFKVLPYFARRGDTKDAIKGATLNRESIANISIPLPPLVEQHRIVVKVDELMGLCDRLEAAQAERKVRRAGLVNSSIGGMAGSSAGSSTRAFCLGNLGCLVRTKSDIDQFRRSILSLAVRGDLAEQIAADERVEAQLERSDQARRAAAQDDHRADNASQELLGAGGRWDAPTSWRWRGLADLVLFIDYRGMTPVKTSTGVPLITAKNVRRGFISRLPEEFLSAADYPKWMTRGIPESGDVLFTTEAPMGNAAVVRLAERFALAQRVICFHSYGAIDPNFLTIQLLSPPFQVILEEASTGLTAKGIKAAKLKRLPIAVPPLPEQSRIAAKVAELMAVCDQLETQLSTAQVVNRRLLDAVLDHALTASARQ